LNQQLLAASAMRSIVGSAALLTFCVTGPLAGRGVQAAISAIAGKATRAMVFFVKKRTPKGHATGED
jgi:hypothetical protein